jgi:hypothetical protein
MFNKNNSGMTVVHEDTLLFISHVGNTIQVDHMVSLGLFLENEFELSSIPAVVRDRKNSLLLVPDYWIGQKDLTLPSRKRSIVAPFVERKLAAEHPDLPDIALFYDYAFAKEPGENGNIYAFYLQDPLSYQLYKKLAAFDMAPHDITIPAYVWEKKLENLHPEKVLSGCGLIQKFSSASYLYFYYKGQFLFSRSIQFSVSTGEGSDMLDALTYEINQSFYLFSQKKKADLSNIFIQSSRKEDADELAESLGREVHFLGLDDDGDVPDQEMTRALGPCGVFVPGDLAPSNHFMTIAQKDHARAREWRPVQLAGAIIGILLFLILAGEHLFLIKWSKQDPGMGMASSMSGQSSREIIQQYNETLDLILAEARRPSSRKTMLDLARCLPENISIKNMKLLVTENPNLFLTCVVRAKDMTDFKDSLSLLLENLGKTFIHSPRLEKRDIELGEIRPGRDYTDYPIQFKIRL